MTGSLDLIVPIKTTGRRRPLYCVHPISGSAYAYAGLARLIDPDRPVYGFEAPGFDNDRQPVTSVAALAAEYVEALLTFRPNEAYCLLGWSMGGVLAFDMAQRLAAAGAEVPVLIIIDANLPPGTGLPAEKLMLYQFLHDLMAVAGLRSVQLGGLVDGLADDAEPARFFATVEQAGILPEEIDAEFLEQRYAVFRAHIEALYTYRIAERYRGRLTLVTASESPAEYMRWETVADNVEEHQISGDHHSMWTGERLSSLTRIVEQSVAEAPTPTAFRRAGQAAVGSSGELSPEGQPGLPSGAASGAAPPA